MAKTVAKDKVLIVRIERFGESIWLTSPYHIDAVEKFKSLKGKWQPTSKTWIFNASAALLVANICHEIWGVFPAVDMVLARPYPEEKPSRKWRSAKETEHITGPVILKEDEGLTHEQVMATAKRFASALPFYLNQMSAEEKEEILKPIFDVL